MCEDIKSGIPMRQKRKYKNTNTQRHKYTNTANDELLERPNMICIYEKRIVQGYQKQYSHVSKAQIQKYKDTNTQIQHMMNNQKKIQNSMLGGGTKNIMPSRKYILRTWLILPRPLPPLTPTALNHPIPLHQNQNGLGCSFLRIYTLNGQYCLSAAP